MIRIATFQDCLAYFAELKVPHKIDAATQLIEIPTELPPLVGQHYIRFEKALPYVQLIQPMVRDVPADRRAEVEHAICVANNTVPLPGFAYQYQNNFIYYRLTLPMYEEGMLATSFQKQQLSLLKNARDFLIPFRQVVDGKPGSQILDLAVAFATASRPGA
ncbi:MAG TPA: hypothetical protein VKE22_22425 [Haliangiales bacterium]|nr:hypothetical protein [Haliangiales bacterium]